MEKNTIEIKNELGYFKNIRSEMLKYIPDKALRILEVGCGEGNFCRLLKRDDREIWGVEINPDAARKAMTVCDKIYSGDFDQLYVDLPLSYFDCIIFNDVLEHLYKPWDTIEKARSLLSSDGVLVCSIPNFRYIGNLITEIVIQKDFRYKPEGGILDDTHIRFFTSKSMLRMFNDNKYEVIKHEGIHPCKSWKEKLLIKISFGLLRDSRYKQFVTVAKPVRLC